MAEVGVELLHLMKSGRVLQYRQQNVALVSAPEGTEFDITYARRWLEVVVGDGAVVLLGDSPYDHADPVRYATVTAAEWSRAGLALTVKVGPWPVVQDVSLLAPPLRAHPTRPPLFTWRCWVKGLRPPQSDDESRAAWRSAVDRLRDNRFYAESNFARLLRVVDPAGHEVRERSLELGQVATVVLEVRSPGGDHPQRSVLVDGTPPGTCVGGVDGAVADHDDRIAVPVRPLSTGTHMVDMSFVPDPLLSTRLSFTIDAHQAVAMPPLTEPAKGRELRLVGEPATSDRATFDPTKIQALADHLRRSLPAPSPEAWLEMLLHHLLPLAPADPVLRSITAEAAYDLHEWAHVVDLLDDPARFRVGDAFRRLIAGLHAAAPTDVSGLLRQIDLGVERNVVLLAKEPLLPDGAVRQIVTVLLDHLAGSEILDRLLADVFLRLRDDLAMRVATECAAANPDNWLDRSLKRWPDPHKMPDAALAEIIMWEIATPELVPYLRHAIEGSVDADDVDRVLELAERARGLLPRPEQVSLQISAARLLLDTDDSLSTAAARDLLLAAVKEASGLGDADLSTELAFTLREFWAEGADDEVDAVIDQLREVLDQLPEFQDWLSKRDADTAAMLRPRVSGKVLHIVGGQRRPGADNLSDDLGLKDLRWHESERKKRPDLDWASATDPERDIAVLIWTHCSHATSGGLDVAGVPYLPAMWSRASILEALGTLSLGP